MHKGAVHELCHAGGRGKISMTNIDEGSYIKKSMTRPKRRGGGVERQKFPQIVKHHLWTTPNLWLMIDYLTVGPFIFVEVSWALPENFFRSGDRNHYNL